MQTTPPKALGNIREVPDGTPMQPGEILLSQAEVNAVRARGLIGKAAYNEVMAMRRAANRKAKRQSAVMTPQPKSHLSKSARKGPRYEKHLPSMAAVLSGKHVSRADRRRAFRKAAREHRTATS